MKMLKKITKYGLGIIISILLCGFTVSATEYTVLETNAILYSNAEAVLYAEADMNSEIILSQEDFLDNIPLQVTGITSNGFFRVDLGVTYYVPGNGLNENYSVDITTSIDLEQQNNNSQIVKDLGYGISFIADKYVDEYYLDIFKGQIEIVDVKIDETTVNDKFFVQSGYFAELNVIFSPSKYGTHRAVNMACVEIVFLDKDGFELGTSSKLIANKNKDVIGIQKTKNTLIPLNTAVITVR